MTLGLAPVTGDVRWTVTGEGDGRSLVFTARSDGSGLEEGRLDAHAAATHAAAATDGRARSGYRPPHDRGPEVHADRVIFRLEDHGYGAVRLQQELERPRSGPPLRRRDGVWEVEYRRPQTDRMEYRFEVDGDSFCDPAEPAPRARRLRRASPSSSSPATAPPAWLAAPDPGPAVPVAEHARLWSPPDTDPRRPLPLLVAHDGSRVRAALAADPPDRPRDRHEPDPALPRRAARRPRPRRGLLRLGPLRPHARRHPPPARPAPPPTPGSARASARSRCCTRAGCTRARSARCCCSPARSSASAGTARSRASRASAASRASSAPSSTTSRAATPIPITLTCGAPEENLANNRAVATALRRQGHDATPARQPRRAQLRRLARRARPAPRRRSSRAPGGRVPVMARTHLIGLLLGTEEDWSGAFETMIARAAPPIEHGGERHEFTHRARHDRAVRPAHDAAPRARDRPPRALVLRAARVDQEGRADGRDVPDEQPVHVPGDGEALRLLRDDAARAEGARHLARARTSSRPRTSASPTPPSATTGRSTSRRSPARSATRCS